MSEDTSSIKTKFCSHCGEKIDYTAVVCPKCGCQVAELKSAQSPIIINNSNTNTNVNTNVNAAAYFGKPKNKWIAFFLCLFFGIFGVHKFYEGKVGMGILYIFTCGLLLIGVIVDLIAILGKPTIYYV